MQKGNLRASQDTNIVPLWPPGCEWMIAIYDKLLISIHRTRV